MRLEGEEIAVDAYGMRDRSWGPRSQFGATLHSSGAVRGGYSYATASDRDGFHAITMDFGGGCIAIHGYVLAGGEYAACRVRPAGGAGPARRRAVPRRRSS